MEQLYQDNPIFKSTYTRHKNRSFTDSIISNQYGASKETCIIRWNGRMPTKELVIHFLEVLSAEEIIQYRTKIFRYLKEHGIEAVANLELTKGEDGTPNNKVHSHVLTDDQRSEDELRELFKTACLRSGLSRDDFRIDYRPLWNGYTYIKYFTKFGYSDEVILFQTGTGLQKFYEIGQWFYKGKAEIWEAIKAFMKEKDGTDLDDTDCENELNEELYADNESSNESVQELPTPDKENEVMTPTPQPQSAVTSTPDDSPKDFAELKECVCKTSDLELRDWMRVLLGEPPLFYTTLPRWLHNVEGQLRQDLILAIDRRLRPVNPVQLKEYVDGKSDRELYDILSRLQGKPTVFNTDMPNWLGLYLLHGHLRQDLLDAIMTRLYNAEDFRIVQALHTYHGIRVNGASDKQQPPPIPDTPQRCDEQHGRLSRRRQPPTAPDTLSFYTNWP